ncbi:LOW QUALITY PROTEIN: hypothetical protein U9M48_032347 [Paspalum notatum var. saurae]|uniref:Reverse transcriptase Ty1/copia-type domain-containing protein n=1 Tax=Paspalum notatum var. saurae TaxID=547442 RepID=A0AAQ3U956_PASNO
MIGHIEALDRFGFELDPELATDVILQSLSPSFEPFIMNYHMNGLGTSKMMKARLVAKGYSQVEEIDFGETFAPMARLEAIRFLLVYATHHDMKLYQMDVKSAFLELERFFTIGRVDTTLFTKKTDNDLFVCQVYVDDIIFGSTNEEYCKEFGNLMAKEFEMSMIGELTFFLRFQNKQLK